MAETYQRAEASAKIATLTARVKELEEAVGESEMLLRDPVTVSGRIQEAVAAERARVKPLVDAVRHAETRKQENRLGLMVYLHDDMRAIAGAFAEYEKEEKA